MLWNHSNLFFFKAALFSNEDILQWMCNTHKLDKVQWLCYQKQTIILVSWTSARLLMTEGEHKVNQESKEQSVRIKE